MSTSGCAGKILSSNFIHLLQARTPKNAAWHVRIGIVTHEGLQSCKGYEKQLNFGSRCNLYPNMNKHLVNIARIGPKIYMGANGARLS